jgi:hypothetical protein
MTKRIIGTVVLGLSFYALSIVQCGSQTSDSVSIPRAAWEQLESAIHGVAEAMRAISSAQTPTPTQKIQPTSQPPSNSTGELAQDPAPPVTPSQIYLDRDCGERPRDRGCCEPHRDRGCCEPHRDRDCCEPHRDRDCCEPHRYRGCCEPHRDRDCCEPHRDHCCEPHRNRGCCERPQVSALHTASRLRDPRGGYWETSAVRGYGGVGRRWPPPFADGYEPSADRYEGAPWPPEDIPYGYED